MFKYIYRAGTALTHTVRLSLEGRGKEAEHCKRRNCDEVSPSDRDLSLACVSLCVYVCFEVSPFFFFLSFFTPSIWFDRELLLCCSYNSSKSLDPGLCTCLQMTSVALLWQWRPRPGSHPRPFLMISCSCVLLPVDRCYRIFCTYKE